MGITGVTHLRQKKKNSFWVYPFAPKYKGMFFSTTHLCQIYLFKHFTLNNWSTCNLKDVVSVTYNKVIFISLSIVVLKIYLTPKKIHKLKKD
jgi:hypothetical protein